MCPASAHLGLGIKTGSDCDIPHPSEKAALDYVDDMACYYTHMDLNDGTSHIEEHCWHFFNADMCCPAITPLMEKGCLCSSVMEFGSQGTPLAYKAVAQVRASFGLIYESYLKVHIQMLSFNNMCDKRMNSRLICFILLSVLPSPSKTRNWTQRNALCCFPQIYKPEVRGHVPLHAMITDTSLQTNMQKSAGYSNWDDEIVRLDPSLRFFTYYTGFECYVVQWWNLQRDLGNTAFCLWVWVKSFDVSFYIHIFNHPHQFSMQLLHQLHSRRLLRRGLALSHERCTRWGFLWLRCELQSWSNEAVFPLSLSLPSVVL